MRKPKNKTSPLRLLKDAGLQSRFLHRRRIEVGTVLVTPAEHYFLFPNSRVPALRAVFDKEAERWGTVPPSGRAGLIIFVSGCGADLNAVPTSIRVVEVSAVAAQAQPHVEAPT